MTNRAIALLGLILTFTVAPGVAAAAGQDLTEMLASNAAAKASTVSPYISLAPLTLDFGIVNNGETGALNLTISNAGGQPLNVSSIAVSDPVYHFGALPGPISAGRSADVVVTFSPSDGGPHPGTLTVSSDASNGDQTVRLAGQANAPPTLNPIGDKA